MGWWYGADLKTGRCARGQPEAAVSVGLTPAGAPALTIGSARWIWSYPSTWAHTRANFIWALLSCTDSSLSASPPSTAVTLSDRRGFNGSTAGCHRKSYRFYWQVWVDSIMFDGARDCLDNRKHRSRLRSSSADFLFFWNTELLNKNLTIDRIDYFK